MTTLALTRFTAVNALGRGGAAVFDALAARRTGLRPCAFEAVTLETYVGEVAGVDDLPVTERLAEFDCRNNRLAQLALDVAGIAGISFQGAGVEVRQADPGHLPPERGCLK